MMMKSNPQLQYPKSRASELGLYKRIVKGLEGQRAYLLVFAVSALFVLSGVASSVRAIVDGRVGFGILALISFAIALIAVVIVVRVVENPRSENERLTTIEASILSPKIIPATEFLAGGSIGIELDDFHSAAKKTKELFDNHSGGRHSLKFLAITGRSLVPAYLGDLIDQYEGYLDIELQVVDPKSPYVKVMPKHWGQEALATIEDVNGRFKARKAPGNLKVWKYGYLPCINGEILNEDHLILCFFGWDHRTKKLGDKKEHYVYYHRNSKTSKVFELFESWFDHAPKSPWELDTKDT